MFFEVDPRQQEWKQLERKHRLNLLINPIRQCSPTRFPLPMHLHIQAKRKVASRACGVSRRKRALSWKREESASNHATGIKIKKNYQPLHPSPLLKCYFKCPMKCEDQKSSPASKPRKKSVMATALSRFRFWRANLVSMWKSRKWLRL